ncbi:hypothetical protein Btru_061178 [Bulinus truncatus]|nr:hypothetical protein Btru_061178 [Bulinus truncatus]
MAVSNSCETRQVTSRETLGAKSRMDYIKECCNVRSRPEERVEQPEHCAGVSKASRPTRSNCSLKLSMDTRTFFALGSRISLGALGVFKFQKTVSLNAHIILVQPRTAMASKKLKSSDDISHSENHKDSIKKKNLSNGDVIKDDSDIDIATVINENGLPNNGPLETAVAQNEKDKEVDGNQEKGDKSNEEDINKNGKSFDEKSPRSDPKKKLTRSASKENKKKTKELDGESENSKSELTNGKSSTDENKSPEGRDKLINLDSNNCDGENIDNGDSKKTAVSKSKKCEPSDNGTDDIEIIGETKVVQVSAINTLLTQNVVFVPAALTSSVTSHNIITQGFTATHSNLLSTPSLQNPILVHSMGSASSQPIQGLPTTTFLTPGLGQSSNPFSCSTPGQVPPSISLLSTNVAPPKPKSSLDQIELIRWEIQNRINTRPKYFKPNSSSELGPLAKFLFDIGSDLIKESVYHDLVKIQSKKNDDKKLSDKERDDLEKLKEIEKDLYATIGHLKLKLKKHCKGCNFHTESDNVLYLHKQYPHEEGKNLRCAHCSFTTKQAVTFKFHMEGHNIQPKLPEKRAFFECDMCPYENNQEQKLILHKQRCIKQFRPLFNLHPGCLSGAEINLCLENIFYKPIIPKNIKILQQKHAQQQAALAEARRQQAQVQALAAQKNAAAIAAKKQQQPRLQMSVNGPNLNFQNNARMSLTKLPGQPQPARYSGANVKTPRPTVANILNNRQNQGATQGVPPSGFEVCEICSGYVKDRKALRIHFFYAHRIDLPFNLFERNQAPLYCATCYVRFWTAQGLRKHIETHKGENQVRGVVGKCISCFEHVTNLLLHMRVVHNRELQHYINALMCMFCGSHFSLRQECERHIIRVHGMIDPLTGVIKSNGTTPPAQSKPPANQKKPPGSSAQVKGSVCVLCNLNFGRNVDLTRHCMRMHHTCMKCGMVVIDKASLLKHTCLSSPSGTRDCCMCSETGFHPAYYVKHLRDKHLKKFSIKVRKLSKKIIERWTKRPYPFDDPKEILVEISDSDEENSGIKKTSPSVPPVKKRPRMGPACMVKKFRDDLLKAEAEVVKIDDDSNDDDVIVEKIEKVEAGSKSPADDIISVVSEENLASIVKSEDEESNTSVGENKTDRTVDDVDKNDSEEINEKMENDEDEKSDHRPCLKRSLSECKEDTDEKVSRKRMKQMIFKMIVLCYKFFLEVDLMNFFSRVIMFFFFCKYTVVFCTFYSKCYDYSSGYINID